MIFKVLDAQGRSCNGGNLQWSLPTQDEAGNWTPGDWMPAIEDELIACENGYHLAEDAQLLDWLGVRIFEAEYRGERVDTGNKLVVRHCRLLREFTGWNERTARLFAVWCAREALKLIDNPDPRSSAACDVAERHAGGQATIDELAAAWDAAWAAARDAAGAAARDAAGAAAWDAAWAAAGAAAWAAAGAAARAAARAAAGDAAWAAARAAARAAAGAAAWDATGDAAWYVTGAAALDAAGDAAWDAAGAAQYHHLLEMMEVHA